MCRWLLPEPKHHINKAWEPKGAPPKASPHKKYNMALLRGY